MRFFIPQHKQAKKQTNDHKQRVSHNDECTTIHRLSSSQLSVLRHTSEKHKSAQQDLTNFIETSSDNPEWWKQDFATYPNPNNLKNRKHLMDAKKEEISELNGKLERILLTIATTVKCNNDEGRKLYEMMLARQAAHIKCGRKIIEGKDWLFDEMNQLAEDYYVVKGTTKRQKTTKKRIWFVKLDRLLNATMSGVDQRSNLGQSFARELGKLTEASKISNEVSKAKCDAEKAAWVAAQANEEWK